MKTLIKIVKFIVVGYLSLVAVFIILGLIGLYFYQ